MAQGFIVIAAAKAAQAGASLDEVVEVTRNNISRVDFRTAFDTLEYLKRGGRIGKAQAFCLVFWLLSLFFTGLVLLNEQRITIGTQ